MKSTREDDFDYDLHVILPRPGTIPGTIDSFRELAINEAGEARAGVSNAGETAYSPSVIFSSVRHRSSNGSTRFAFMFGFTISQVSMDRQKRIEVYVPL